MGTLSLDKEKKLEADVEKAEKKAERKAAKEEESKKSLKVRLTSPPSVLRRPGLPDATSLVPGRSRSSGSSATSAST